jgi:hypothetical protein
MDIGGAAANRTHIAREEDQEGDGADHDDGVAPPHVRRARATRFDAVAASWQVGGAAEVRDEAIGNDRAYGDAERLEKGKQGEEEASVLGQELEDDGRVDRYVAAQAKPGKGCQHANRRKVVRWRCE